jgi:hypothetical protein
MLAGDMGRDRSYAGRCFGDRQGNLAGRQGVVLQPRAADDRDSGSGRKPLASTLRVLLSNASLSLWPLVSVLRANRAIETAPWRAWREDRGKATARTGKQGHRAPDIRRTGVPSRTIGSRRGLAPALDEAYQTFFELVARHIGSAIADATAYAQERQRAEVLAEFDHAKATFFSKSGTNFAPRSTPLQNRFVATQPRSDPSSPTRVTRVRRAIEAAPADNGCVSLRLFGIIPTSISALL